MEYKGLLLAALLLLLGSLPVQSLSASGIALGDEYSSEVQTRALAQLSQLKGLLNLNAEQESKVKDICLKTAERYIRIEADYARDKGKYTKSVQHAMNVQYQNIMDVLQGEQVKVFKKNKKVLRPRSWKQIPH